MSDECIETLAFEAHSEFVTEAEALRRRAREFESQQRREVDAFNAEQEEKHRAALARFRARLGMPEIRATH